MKQLLFFILTLFVLTLSAQIQEIGCFSNSNDSLFLAKMNNKYGIINRKGNWLVKPFLDSIGKYYTRDPLVTYYGKLAINGIVCGHNLSQYPQSYYNNKIQFYPNKKRLVYTPNDTVSILFNEDGEEILSVSREIKYFPTSQLFYYHASENAYDVKVFDKNGQFVQLPVHPYFREVLPYWDYQQTEDQRILYKDKITKLLHLYDSVEVIYEEYFTGKKEDSLYLIDQNMNVLIKGTFDEFEITEKYIIGKELNLCGIYDVTGNEILPCEYFGIEIIHDTLFRTQGLSYIDLYNREGNSILDFEFDDLIVCGKNIIKILNQEKTIVDFEGNLIRNNTYSNIDWNKKWKLFEVFTDDGKQGILDQTGQEVLASIYDQIDIFKNVFLVKKKDSMFVFDRQKNEILFVDQVDKYAFFTKNKYQFYMTSLHFLQIKKHNQWGVIDIYGIEILPAKYESQDALQIDLQSKYYVISTQNKYQVFSYNHKKIGRKYTDIGKSVLPSSYILAQRNNYWGVINVNNENVVPFQYTHLLVPSDRDFFLMNEYSQSFILIGETKEGTYHVIDQKGNILAQFFNEKEILNMGFDNVQNLMIRQGTGILFISVDEFGVHSEFHDYKY